MNFINIILILANGIIFSSSVDCGPGQDVHYIPQSNIWACSTPYIAEVNR